MCLRGTTLAVSKEGTSVIEILLFTDFGLITGGALFHSSIAIQGNVRGYHQCHVSSVQEKEGFPLQLLPTLRFFFMGKVNSTKLHENGAERMGGGGRDIQLHSHSLGFKEMEYF